MMAGRITGSAISVGDTFTKLVERKAEKKLNADGSFEYAAEDIAASEVFFRVVALEAYRRSFQSLEPGMTAGITLEGVAFEALARTIAQDSPHRYFILRGG